MDNKIKEIIREYDEEGKEIHYKSPNVYEYWKEYNEKGKVIHYKDSDGYELWYEYDNNGNMIYYKNSNKFEEWYEYDEKGNIIQYKNSNKFEEWYEYDNDGKIINYEDSNGFKCNYIDIRKERVICDRCGRIIDEEEGSGVVSIHHENPSYEIKDKNIFCKDCCDSFKDWLERKHSRDTKEWREFYNKLP